MIPVQSKPEYPDFDAQVRQRGQAFLQRNPSPNSREFRKHNYWTMALGNLYEAYDRVCAYTSRELTHSGSVDHYRPKSKHPHLAYEWDNYRLARQTINARKGESEEVVDPFIVQQGWFTLDLPSCLIKPGQGLSREIRSKVNSTINTLGLNRDEGLVGERCSLLINLADGHVTLDYLNQHYRFLYIEVVRQDVHDSLREIFSMQQNGGE